MNIQENKPSPEAKKHDAVSPSKAIKAIKLKHKPRTSDKGLLKYMNYECLNKDSENTSKYLNEWKPFKTWNKINKNTHHQPRKQNH